jgi:hypothetical protein
LIVYLAKKEKKKERKKEKKRKVTSKKIYSGRTKCEDLNKTVMAKGKQ